MDPKRLALIAEVAAHYYYENKTVKEIATYFEVSPSSVSRLLQEARDQKIVQIFIRYPFLTIPSLGKELETQLGLSKAYVLPEFQGNYINRVQRVGQLAARVLEEQLENGMTLAVSLGGAVGYTATAFTMVRSIQCNVVRLHGATDLEIIHGNNIAQLFSSLLGNQLKIIPSPFILQNQAAAELILSEPSVQDVLRIAENADIALVGVGTLDPEHSTMLQNNLINTEELFELQEQFAVGEICGKYYDQDGNVCASEFNKRTVSIDLEKLCNIKTVIGVAVGESKVGPILGAVRGKYITELVTDADTARLLLDRSANDGSEPMKDNNAGN